MNNFLRKYVALPSPSTYAIETLVLLSWEHALELPLQPHASAYPFARARIALRAEVD